MAWVASRFRLRLWLRDRFGALPSEFDIHFSEQDSFSSLDLEDLSKPQKALSSREPMELYPLSVTRYPKESWEQGVMRFQWLAMRRV
jgi:hypothetical protein